MSILMILKNQFHFGLYTYESSFNSNRSIKNKISTKLICWNNNELFFIKEYSVTLCCK